eukprot:GHVQ01003730.1.p1 GENE.GHVQ01003730.1~~GHVQ01003730.1.p1  ORF type:complete len:132 (+),score=9.28 GHVQ01003730.1:248-643(+)
MPLPPTANDFRFTCPQPRLRSPAHTLMSSVVLPSFLRTSLPPPAPLLNHSLCLTATNPPSSICLSQHYSVPHPSLRYLYNHSIAYATYLYVGCDRKSVLYCCSVAYANSVTWSPLFLLLFFATQVFMCVSA